MTQTTLELNEVASYPGLPVFFNVARFNFQRATLKNTGRPGYEAKMK